MTNCKLSLKNYWYLFKTNLRNLEFLDLFLFSTIVNINISNFLHLPRTVIILIGTILIKKSISDYNLTIAVENVFFITGTKIKKLVLVNFYLNNFIFIIISMTLLFFNLSSFGIILENFYVLNLLMCITFLLKFAFPFVEITKSFFLLRIIKSVIYYSLFSLFLIGISYSLSSTFFMVSIFYFLINYFNRTLNYYDINQ